MFPYQAFLLQGLCICWSWVCYSVTFRVQLNITSELSPATPYKRSLHRNALCIALTTSQNGRFFWPAALSTRTVAPGRPSLSPSVSSAQWMTPLHSFVFLYLGDFSLPGSGSQLAPPPGESWPYLATKVWVVITCGGKLQIASAGYMAISGSGQRWCQVSYNAQDNPTLLSSPKCQ